MAGSQDVLMAGATGLVGSAALTGLLHRAAHDDFRVIVASRRPLALAHERLQVVVADPGRDDAGEAVEWALAESRARLGSFVCTLGTTLRAAGSESAFAAVDRDLVLQFAAIARRYGARQALVVSSVGAATASSNFYLRIKGEMEVGLLALGFERTDILQPGLLLGPRGNDRRTGERVAQALAPLYNPLLRGPLRRLRAIPATTVAAAIVALVGHPDTGVMMLENPAIEQYASDTPPA